jgi:hypothetical protein
MKRTLASLTIALSMFLVAPFANADLIYTYKDKANQDATSVLNSFFLDIPSIPGGSNPLGYTDVIGLNMVYFDYSNNSFSVLKPLDIATPKLLAANVNGIDLISMDLLLFASDGSVASPNDMVLHFTNPYVTSIVPSVNQFGENALELVTFQFQQAFYTNQAVRIIPGPPSADPQVAAGFAFTSAVPEPPTYTMLLAGLGLVGFMARRRKDQTA